MIFGFCLYPVLLLYALVWSWDVFIQVQQHIFTYLASQWHYSIYTQLLYVNAFLYPFISQNFRCKHTVSCLCFTKLLCNRHKRSWSWLCQFGHNNPSPLQHYALCQDFESAQVSVLFWGINMQHKYGALILRCESVGLFIHKPGTDTADAECEIRRHRVILWAELTAVCIFLVILLLSVWCWRKPRRQGSVVCISCVWYARIVYTE